MGLGDLRCLICFLIEFLLGWPSVAVVDFAFELALGAGAFGIADPFFDC